MSIATEITRLQNAKASIKTAIEEKGVTVADTVKLDGFASLIASSMYLFIINSFLIIYRQ